MLNLDRYPHLGSLHTFADEEDMILMVHRYFPDAHAEGSTGSERTWWSGINLVAHSWSPAGKLALWNVRVIKR